MAQKGDGRRVLRFEKELRQELGVYLLVGFKHDLPGMVSISRVMAAKDLKSAKVYVAVMGTESEKEKAVESLNSYRFDAQTHLARALRLRFCPRLTFYVDETTEKMLKVERILHEIEAHRKTEA